MANQLITLPFMKKQLELKKVLIIAVSVVGGFCLVSAIMPSVTNSFIPDGEETRMVNAYKQQGATDAQISQVIPDLFKNMEVAR